MAVYNTGARFLWSLRTFISASAAMLDHSTGSSISPLVSGAVCNAPSLPVLGFAKLPLLWVIKGRARAMSFPNASPHTALACVCLPDQTLLTQHGLLLGTPEYTSPEQAALGRFDRDVTTDVYSLGVLMYELISSRPFERGELEKKGYAESLRVIREEGPFDRPSDC